jgi:hypothetical protein
MLIAIVIARKGVNIMKYDSAKQWTKIWKCFFALPRDKLCLKKRPDGRNEVEAENNEENIDSAHGRLGRHQLEWV